MTPPEPPSGLDSDIFPPEPPQHAVPGPLPLVEFKSWHLPRKQWVRRHQWAKFTAHLLTTLAPVDRPLRYLGLPGTELLDLEVLAGVCAQADTTLRFLGFNRGSQNPGERTTQQLAEDAVKSLEAVDSRSFVVTDDILALSSPTSIATRRLRDFESFDVVNLDLCDIFTTGLGRPVHAAVKSILEFQTNRRSQPWLLFVTTAIDRPVIADEDVRQYRELFLQNANASQEFRDSLTGLSEPAPAAPAGAPFVDPFEGATGARFGRLLSVGLGKWLLSVVRQPVPWTVELKSCVGYRRGMTNIPAGRRPVAEPELFSLVFKLERAQHHLVDPTNLAPPTQTAATRPWPELEQQSAVQIVRMALQSIDLDCWIQQHPQDRQTLADESATMLGLRNYDIAKYHEWANSVPEIPC